MKTIKLLGVAVVYAIVYGIVLVLFILVLPLLIFLKGVDATINGARKILTLEVWRKLIEAMRK